MTLTEIENTNIHDLIEFQTRQNMELEEREKDERLGKETNPADLFNMI